MFGEEEKVNRLLLHLVPTVLLVSGCTGAPAAEQPAAEPNLIRNPSLEIDADGDGFPDGWRTAAEVEYHLPRRLGKTPWTLERSPVHHTGAWSLHYGAAVVDPPKPSTATWWDFTAWKKRRSRVPATWAVPVVTNRFPVLGEHDYLLRMWLKARGVRLLHLKFIGHYKGHPETKTYWTQPLLRSPEGRTHVSGSWEWKPFETHLFVPGGQNWGRLEVWLWQDGQPGDLWVDDVEARLVAPATR